MPRRGLPRPCARRQRREPTTDSTDWSRTRPALGARCCSQSSLPSRSPPAAAGCPPAPGWARAGGLLPPRPAGGSRAPAGARALGGSAHGGQGGPAPRTRTTSWACRGRRPRRPRCARPSGRWRSCTTQTSRAPATATGSWPPGRLQTPWPPRRGGPSGPDSSLGRIGSAAASGPRHRRALASGRRAPPRRAGAAGAVLAAGPRGRTAGSTPGRRRTSDWMDEDDLEDAEAWDVEWGGGRRGEARWEGWAPWDDEDRGRRGGQQRGGRERRQGGGREDSLETQLKVAQDEEAHRRHLDRERLWKEELGKARERAKETQKLGWSDQLSQLKADNYQRRGRERLRWALKTNQTRDEREAWKEAAAQRWVERFRLAEEESNRRREETARFYAEKIRRAREEARRLREERAALEEARLSKWEHLEKQLQEKSQRMWSDAFQEALRTNCDEQDEERHWAAFLEQAQQSQRSLPKKWSSRFFRLMQDDHMDNHVAQTKFWERSFRKAMDFSSSKASEDAAFWQGQIRKANAKDFKQRAEINQKQLQQFRSHEKQFQGSDFQVSSARRGVGLMGIPSFI
ncbi:unnamed protein product [Prorocentrum cordatum]|uniref:Uncharacterized protein n=1 Tax=Prorocentrum cordatum TaxID=2364126 RepID=A0ABN9T8G7_9DINO|nr:unnamed protein product [Polarella glacialis]